MMVTGRETNPVRSVIAFTLAVAAFFIIPVAGAAQQLTPEMIERLQRQSGGTIPQSDPAEQFDRSRQGNLEEPEFGLQDPSGLQTEEERQLRRLQSRQAIERLEMPSPLEAEYQERLSAPDLRQFGYDLFRSTSADSGTVTGQVGDGYILGVGDELLVTFTGANNQSSTARVARDGRLIVGSLPPIQAAGRSLGQIRRQLAGATRNSLLGTDVYVSLGGIRSVTVFIGGEVERPGQYQVTSLTDIASILSKAGGIRKSGSLRNVILHRGGASRRIDLYGLLGIGSPPSTGVQEGDRIVVPVIGDTAAISGGVARPAIYELRGRVSVNEFLSYAGGAVPPRGYRMTISRIGDDGQETLIDAVSSASSIEPGDGVLVFGGGSGGALNRVVLSGFIANPGPRALSAASTIGDLLGRPEQLQLGTYLPMAALVRRSRISGLREYVAVDLADALGGGSNRVSLRGDDELFIFEREDIDYLNSANILGVLAGDPVAQCAAEIYLQNLVASTQSPRFNALLRNSFIRAREDQSSIVAAGNALGEATTADGEIEDTRLTPEDDIRSVYCRPIFEDIPQLLPFVLEQTVSVGGAIRRPGAYPIAGHEDAETLIAVAEGTLAAVSDGTVDVSRGDMFERFALPAENTDQRRNLSNVILSPGDELRVTAPLRNGEEGAVLLTGEFRSPGLYAIRPGERLSQLIARAGGYTEAAYPYGAVFTREKVRVAERDAQKRASRELRESVLVLAARDEVDAEAVQAATTIIETMNEVEPVGRMVVEADPRALAVRADLDPLLEAGDAVHVPNKPNSVYVFGNVLNPGALQFQADKKVGQYLGQAGGAQTNSDESRIFIVFPDGTAQPIKRSFWRTSNVAVPPGATVIVPKDLSPFRGLEIAGQITGVLGGLAQAVATAIILSDRN